MQVVSKRRKEYLIRLLTPSHRPQLILSQSSTPSKILTKSVNTTLTIRPQTSTISSCLSPTTTTSYTLWNEAVLNIDPDTSQLFIPEPNNTRIHRVIADLNVVEDDLLKLRKEKHEKWKSPSLITPVPKLNHIKN